MEWLRVESRDLYPIELAKQLWPITRAPDGPALPAAVYKREWDQLHYKLHTMSGGHCIMDKFWHAYGHSYKMLPMLLVAVQKTGISCATFEYWDEFINLLDYAVAGETSHG